MFDFSWSEIALLVVVALIFIGPKDLPVAIRTLSRGLKAIRKMAAEFQTHVDDMVRDADLSEARDQFRDLKRFDFRDRVTKVIDGDHTIRRSLEVDAPNTALPAGAAAGIAALPRVPAPPPPPPAPESSGFGQPSFGGGVMPYNTQIQAEERALAAAPAILPPTTARRLLNERARWRAPDILPPVLVIHHGRRVAISTEKDGA